MPTVPVFNPKHHQPFGLCLSGKPQIHRFIISVPSQFFAQIQTTKDADSGQHSPRKAKRWSPRRFGWGQMHRFQNGGPVIPDYGTPGANKRMVIFMIFLLLYNPSWVQKFLIYFLSPERLQATNPGYLWAQVSCVEFTGMSSPLGERDGMHD